MNAFGIKMLTLDGEQMRDLNARREMLREALASLPIEESLSMVADELVKRDDWDAARVNDLSNLIGQQAWSKL